MMKARLRNKGTALLMTIFIVALLSAIVIGMLQLNTEEIRIMRNQIWAAEALVVAKAGLNDALAEIRLLDTFNNGYNKPFAGGTYLTNIQSNLPNVTLESTGTSSQGFVARVEADITVGTNGPPYAIAIDELRINE